MAGEIVLLDFWSSSYAMRIKIALEEKGVNYVCKGQDLANKSSLLLEMNPVTKMVPVLIHDGKPVCESLVIVEYIDEVWAGSSSLLPSDPYQRSQARFWADFIDDKIFPCAKKLWRVKGEEQKTIIKEFIEGLKLLEDEVLKEEKFFGGDKFGIVDVALVSLTSWFYALEICGNFNIEENCPKLIRWAERCKERSSVTNSLPKPQEIYGFVLYLKQMFGLD